MRHASCTKHVATIPIMHHAICIMHHALCILHHAECTMHRAPSLCILHSRNGPAISWDLWNMALEVFEQITVQLFMKSFYRQCSMFARVLLSFLHDQVFIKAWTMHLSLGTIHSAPSNMHNGQCALHHAPMIDKHLWGKKRLRLLGQILLHFVITSSYNQWNMLVKASLNSTIKSWLEKAPHTMHRAPIVAGHL